MTSLLSEARRRILTTGQHLERFWNRVVKGGACWESGPTYQVTGYGQTPGLAFGRQSMTAHRFAWMATHGPVPPGMYLLHACDNRRCVNPAHLRVGTARDNMQDMIRKGRSGARKGQPRRKLTAEQVAEIRGSTETAWSLAQRFGVDHGTVRYHRRLARAASSNG